MNLLQALRASGETQAAFVGSGGKTTALFQLARQLEPPVVVTASTHLGNWQAGFADRHFILERVEDLEGYVSQIEGVTLFSGPGGDNHRLNGLSEALLERLHQTANELGFPLLVEADGSRQRPLKAPAAHEPAIPGWVNHVVVCAGMTGLWNLLDEKTVHRPAEFARISGIAEGDEITPEGLVNALLHPLGGMKNIPGAARRSLILNQVDREGVLEQVLAVASQLTSQFHSVSICALEEHKIWANVERSAGVVLAAGGAKRYGAPKLLLPWKGKPLVRHVVEAALGAGLSQVQVVVGAVDAPVRDALAGLAVNFVPNPDWADGQSTSVRAGIQSLAEYTGAVVFLSGDQPNVPAALIRALVERHQRGQEQVLATSVGGKRGSPVLFDRSTFAALEALQGDTGGRAIFGQYPPQLLEWDDPAVLLDVDTPDDFARLTGAG
jgi:molybdenum cofactor cytidylyltransferase